MPKIKHFQGYGSVTANVLSKRKFIEEPYEITEIKILVKGNHECGLEVNHFDKYMLAQFLGKVGGFGYSDVYQFSSRSYNETNITKGIEEEHCLYKIWLRHIKRG